jgi:uncharacterized membrane protein
MASPASLRNHPIHPMLVPFPIALWIFSFVCDVVYALGWGDILWKHMAFYSMAGGIVGALVAAIPGIMDYRSLSDPHVKRIGSWHMAINLTSAALFAVNLWLRWGGAPAETLPMVLSLLGIALLSISGWLGGELVYVHGVAVERNPPSEQERRVRLP